MEGWAFDRPEWMEEGLCAQSDPDAWYPGEGGSPVPAQEICNGREREPGCPVRDECLAYALANDERFGVWGGLSEKQRKKLKQRVA